MENRFLALRRAAGIGQRELCRRFGEGFYNPHISDLESGKRKPTIKELKAYHNYFHVSYEYLLGEKDWKEEVKQQFSSDHIFHELSKSEDPFDKMIYQMLDEILSTHAGLFLFQNMAEYLYSYDPHNPQQYKGIIGKTHKAACSQKQIEQQKERLLEIIDYIKKNKTDNIRYNELQMLFKEED